jgi:hypothetical protein
MAQRSLHVVTKIYYRSMSSLLQFSTHSGPACGAEVSRTQWPLLHHVVQAVHIECHTDGSHRQEPSHSTEHDTQHIAYLISKQVVPYRTRSDSCCPVVSTPKIRSLVDLSIISHITWWNPTVFTISTLLKPQHRSLPGPNHISTDGRPPLTKTQAKLNITKDGKTYTTLMTAWLSITTPVWTQNPKVWDLGIVLKHTGQCVY